MQTESFNDPHTVLFQLIKKKKLDFIITLPDNRLKRLINYLLQDRSIRCLIPTREEEGVGIAAGAFLAGKIPLVIIQNSGIGNSINALTSLAFTYKIGMLFLVVMRGVGSDASAAQKKMGNATRRVLQAIDADIFEVNCRKDIKPQFLSAYQAVKKKSLPAFVLIHGDLLK